MRESRKENHCLSYLHFCTIEVQMKSSSSLARKTKMSRGRMNKREKSTEEKQWSEKNKGLSVCYL